ncbi:MAG: DinB family protein [Acidimicrobiales bacterium]
MDHCDECGFVYADHVGATIPDKLMALAGRYRGELLLGVEDPTRMAALRRRPAPEVWSAIEYACHYRDVLLVQRDRLFRALVEEAPSFARMHRDERVVLARYAEEDPKLLAAELALAAGMIARVFVRLGPASWERTCVYGFPDPTERDVAWLAQHTVHEGTHHLLDIERVLASGSG